MAYHLSFFHKILPWIAVLVPTFIFAGLLCFEILPIILFTSTLLILSAIIFTSSKNKPIYIVHEGSSLEDASELHLETEREKSSEEKQDEELLQTSAEKKETPERKPRQVQNSSVVRSCDSSSGSEGIDQTSTSYEDSETEWPLLCTADPSSDCSDESDACSISDEESLIEIALPSGQCKYIGDRHDHRKKEETRFDLPQQKFLMDPLAEINDMNEEDNLIEIDISMGSIKFPCRLEIEA